MSRPAAVLWNGTTDAFVIKSGSLGFAGAPEADRVRWINAFGRLLDGLDAPMQVVIAVEPGGEQMIDQFVRPIDLDDTRSADTAFVDQISRSSTAHRCSVSLVTAEAQASRLEPPLREMAIGITVGAASREGILGTELAGHFLHSGGLSRTWCVERLPGGDLEPGWLHRL